MWNSFLHQSFWLGLTDFGGFEIVRDVFNITDDDDDDSEPIKITHVILERKNNKKENIEEVREEKKK